MVILVIGSPSLVFELSVYFSNHLIIYETEHIIKFISEPQNCIISHQPLFLQKKEKMYYLLQNACVVLLFLAAGDS